MALCELVHENPDVFRIRVPLPKNALREMNSYVVRDGGDVLVIDTGFDVPECLAHLRAAFDELGFSERDASLLITHAHADHCGLAGTLACENVYVHPDAFKVMRDVTSRGWHKIQAATTMEMGFTAEETQTILQESASSNQGSCFDIDPVYVGDGDEVRVGRYAFKCLHTPGHAPGHLCLYLPEQELLFTGDHILFDISPNITHWTVSDDTLADYLHNLTALRDMPVSLALPGHREPRGEIAWRIDELLHHHDLRLRECLDAVAIRDGQVACDIAQRVSWARGRKFLDMPYAQKLFAAGETRAHVEHLVRLGKVTREEIEGQVRYTACK